MVCSRADAARVLREVADAARVLREVARGGARDLLEGAGTRAAARELTRVLTRRDLELPTEETAAQASEEGIPAAKDSIVGSGGVVSSESAIDFVVVKQESQHTLTSNTHIQVLTDFLTIFCTDFVTAIWKDILTDFRTGFSDGFPDGFP